jgi:hypothetical protein
VLQQPFYAYLSTARNTKDPFKFSNVKNLGCCFDKQVHSQHGNYFVTTYQLLSFPSVSIVKGSGRGGRQQQQQQQQPALGEEGDFALHASVYGKVQAEDNVNPNNREGEGKKKKLVLALAGLSSYLCSLCAVCQSVQARG